MFVPVIIGVLLLAGFIGSALTRGDAALVDLRLLRHRPLATAIALLYLSSAVLYGPMLLESRGDSSG